MSKHWHHQRTLTIALVNINRKTDVDVRALLQLGFTVRINGIRIFHVWHRVGDGTYNCITNKMRVTDFALTSSSTIVIDDLAIHLK